MLGSRAVAVLGVGETVSEAEEKAEACARTVKGNVFYRNDIGKDSLLSKRILRMKDICEKND
jgi:phosphoribosylamine-glycine ligase